MSKFNILPAAQRLIQEGGQATPEFFRFLANLFNAATVTTSSVASGGTGNTSLTAHGVLIGEGTSPVAVTAAGASGALLVGQGAFDPAFKAVSGDGTVDATGKLVVTKTNGSALTALATAAIGQIPGTATNDNAGAGDVGEYISSTVLAGAAINLTSSTPADVTSVSLTAGDWDISGNVMFDSAGTTVPVNIIGWISTVSATVPTPPNAGAIARLGAAFNTGGIEWLPVGTMRLSLNATKTVYLSCQSAFTTSTMVAYGFIGARRAR